MFSFTGNCWGRREGWLIQYLNNWNVDLRDPGQTAQKEKMEMLTQKWRKRCLAEHLNNGRKYLKSMNQIITLSTGISFSALIEFLLLFRCTAPLTWLIYGLSLLPGTPWQSQDSGTCRVFLKCTSVSAKDRKKIWIISHLILALPVVYGTSNSEKSLGKLENQFRFGNQLHLSCSKAKTASWRIQERTEF